MPPRNIRAEATTKQQKPQKINGCAQLMIESPAHIRDWPRTSLRNSPRRSPTRSKRFSLRPSARIRSRWYMRRRKTAVATAISSISHTAPYTPKIFSDVGRLARNKPSCVITRLLTRASRKPAPGSSDVS